MLKTKFVVGAYASLPKSREEQKQYYDLLGTQNWVAGTEIPYPGDLADPQTRAWLANAIPSSWHKNTITAIPGTMRHINFDPDPEFGLASPDEEGRLRAISFFKDIRQAIADFANLRNSCDISHIEIHTAPTRIATGILKGKIQKKASFRSKMKFKSQKMRELESQLIGAAALSKNATLKLL